THSDLHSFPTRRSSDLIIAAMDEEIEFILQHLIKQKRETIAECLFINGQLHSREVILLKSGIGKVNAAMATTILHERYKPDVIRSEEHTSELQSRFDLV